MGDREVNIENKIEVLNVFDDFKYILGNIEKVNSKLKDQLITKNHEQQDLLHEIELSKLNAIELTIIAKRLRTVRIERRKIKEKLEYIEVLKRFTDKYNNSFKIYADMGTVRKELDRLEEEQKSRFYIPRVLKDLKIGKGKKEDESGTLDSGAIQPISEESEEDQEQ